MIWIVGDWFGWKLNAISDRTLRKVTINVHNEIAAKISSLQTELMHDMGEHNGSNVSELMIESAKETQNEYSAGLILPVYFRKLYQQQVEGASGMYEGILSEKVERTLHSILQNELVLDRTRYETGNDGAAECFLCAAIADEDLPWDPEEVDW
jgi:hypothetical protein